MTLENVQKLLKDYFPVSKTFGHSPMKKPNAPLLTLSVCPLSQFYRSLFQKSQSHSFNSKKAQYDFSYPSWATILLKPLCKDLHIKRIPIIFKLQHKIKGLSMSKSQYKMDKISDVLQKMRISTLFQKLNIYKPHLLINNDTDLAFIGNNEFFKRFAYRQKHLSYVQIKSCLAIQLKFCKLYSKNLVPFLHDWKIHNLNAITFLTNSVFKTASLQKIDKTIMLVYMAILGGDNEVIPKISKPHGKAATWRSEHGLFMR